MVWKGTPSGDHLAPCLVTLIDEIDARAPRRDRRSDGSIGDRAHASRTSDHNPDSNGVVRALDITDDPEHFDPDDFAEVLRKRKDSRIKYVISDRRMFSSYATSSRPAWQWGAYSGSNPHEKHLHISTLPEADNDCSTWFPAPPEPEPTPAAEPIPDTEDDPMHLLIVNDLYAEAGRKAGTDARGRAYWALELRKIQDDTDAYLTLLDYIRSALKK